MIFFSNVTSTFLVAAYPNTWSSMGLGVDRNVLAWLLPKGRSASTCFRRAFTFAPDAYRNRRISSLLIYHKKI